MLCIGHNDIIFNVLVTWHVIGLKTGSLIIAQSWVPLRFNGKTVCVLNVASIKGSIYFSRCDVINSALMFYTVLIDIL